MTTDDNPVFPERGPIKMQKPESFDQVVLRSINAQTRKHQDLSNLVLKLERLLDLLDVRTQQRERNVDAMLVCVFAIGIVNLLLIAAQLFGVIP